MTWYVSIGCYADLKLTRYKYHSQSEHERASNLNPSESTFKFQSRERESEKQNETPKLRNRVGFRLRGERKVGFVPNTNLQRDTLKGTVVEEQPPTQAQIAENKSGRLLAAIRFNPDLSTDSGGDFDNKGSLEIEEFAEEKAKRRERRSGMFLPWGLIGVWVKFCSALFSGCR
ncbi:hypothetical protein V5O48_002170 [Marasmius crinis-equi]|uniref:Uncharacterized protein n=1 Tax=Marasmius crinis-equi TaxID=585013 RepID=A0ABR3FWF3_9AGAR